MIGSSSRPYIIGACVALTIIIILSLQTRRESFSATSKWLDYESDKTPVIPEHSNYVSATTDSRLKPADTTSEIGRASNATLGVCICFFSLFISKMNVSLTDRQSV